MLYIWKQNINIDRKYGKKTDNHIFMEDNQFTFFIYEIINQRKFSSAKTSYNVDPKFKTLKYFLSHEKAALNVYI